MQWGEGGRSEKLGRWVGSKCWRRILWMANIITAGGTHYIHWCTFIIAVWCSSMELIDRRPSKTRNTTGLCPFSLQKIAIVKKTKGNRCCFPIKSIFIRTYLKMHLIQTNFVWLPHWFCAKSTRQSLHFYFVSDRFSSVFL